MAASSSRPGCPACAEMADNVSCGVCADQSKNIAMTATKRRQSVKRAIKRIGGLPSDGTSRRANARCRNDHTWQTANLPGRDDEIEDPRCPDCGEWPIHVGFILGVYVAEVACLDDCKNAKNDDCRCSCAGVFHGVNLGKFKHVKTKKRR